MVLNTAVAAASMSPSGTVMLTGARRGEVRGATRSMFDLENAIWTKPSAHTKQRKLHQVPLSGHAIRLLKGMKETASGPYVPSVETLRTDPYVPSVETLRTDPQVSDRGGWDDVDPAEVVAA
jgi:integrase